MSGQISLYALKAARPTLWVAMLLLQGCTTGGDSYTLYRNSPLDPSMRVHVATFEAADGEKYNQENCALASDLFGAQPGVTSGFWCEKGKFKE